MANIQRNKRQIVVFVDLAPQQAIETVKENMPGVTVLLLRDKQHKSADAQKNLHVDYLEYVNFKDPYDITRVLLPYQNDMIAITARGENGAARLSEIVPHVPYLRTPTADSLRWAMDKYEMRRHLNAYDTNIVPKFTRLKDVSDAELDRVINKVGFPLVVKPASLEESKLVTICYHEEDFKKAAKNIFRKLKSEYKKLNRLQIPTVLAEAFMEGDMYSIDSYVDSRGRVWHCPLVRVKTGKDIGHGDFFNYLQMTPTILKPETVSRAQSVTEKAIHALGLRSLTTHIELMKIDDEWKVIEVGPRIGGFRPLLYELSCGINHSLNDIFIRKPKSPILPKKCQGYACAMKWFAKNEGLIVEMKGIKKIEELESFHSITINKKIGDRAIFARNGGKSIFNLFLYNSERPKLLADIRRIEQMVEVKVARRTISKIVTKKPVSALSKKKVVKN